MVDKKTAVIAFLCVATILCLGLWANAGQETRTLEGALIALGDRYDLLNTEYAKLVEDNDRLEWFLWNATTVLEDREAAYKDLKSKYNSLKDDYSALTTSHINWQRMYSEVKEDYDELYSTTEAGEAIAESAEWVSEDERLKVTSKLITSGTYWVTYTVSVTITNVGDEPIDKVCIFLFPYKVGKFVGTYIAYKSHTVESIYIGETYSHDFTVSEDMTSYKVLAVAG